MIELGILWRFLPLLVIAFATGTLFRIADQHGIAAFRMFGTWGIVAIGIWGSSILRGIQRESGLKTLEERLVGLSDRVSIEPLGAVNKLPIWKLQTPRGTILLGASDVSNSARTNRAAQALRRHARAVIDAASNQGALRKEERTEAALVLLRRGLNGRDETIALSDDFPPVRLINPERLDDLIGAGA